ncbi:hypothetical protein GGR56DRAFT_632727 [Xylariaceae sp. FL0804]|nr:hypothetical protein GGR56DRAFT_632727 [Xylariaceae sp. FL0804]
MANSTRATDLPASRSSTALTPAGLDDAATAAMRPRNRRGPAAGHGTPGQLQTPSTSRAVSPMPSARPTDSRLHSGGRMSPSNNFSRGLLEGSWAPRWASVQDFATSLLDGGYSSEPSRPSSRSGSKHRRPMWKGVGANNSGTRRLPDSWGPAPPPTARPVPDDIAAGSREERETQLKARKKASVLESHEGVNGGLDITGKYKRRNSDENLRSASQPVIEEHMVYLHHVQPTDTYAGVILRYRCMEHAFRKINGLWSRDNIQVRRQLMIPVDACEVKGRPCNPPSQYSRQVDHLAATPQPPDLKQLPSPSKAPQPLHDDYFGSLNGKPSEPLRQAAEEDQPWTHVRWVKLDSLQEPVEIVRVKRTAVGYFPPRRKKSIHTTSTFSTPRHSFELSKPVTNSSEAVESPGRLKSRRQSSLSGRPTPASIGSPASARSRVNSLGQGEGVPAWMRRPGGVGSMGKKVKAPGPAKDYLNTWVNKRLPGLNIDTMPSMSVMGSESAHFGFVNTAEDHSGIVESPFEEGRDAAAPSARNGMGLEQAAASVETWLRGAWAKRPDAPKLRGSHRKAAAEDLDLIELTDTNSDDDRLSTLLPSDTGLLDHHAFRGSTSRSDGEGSVRGRPLNPTGAAKGKKTD